MKIKSKKNQNYQYNADLSSQPQSRFLSLLFPYDIYARPFQLSYRGSQQISTSIGRLLTTFVMCLMLSYSAYRARTMLMKSEYQVMQSQITQQIDFNNTEIIQLNTLGYDLAVQMFK